MILSCSISVTPTKSIPTVSRGALVLSALVFSLFHHIGPGAEAFTQRIFVFRAMAGLVLGALFILRGFGVCVYAHALYDLHYYVTT